MLCWVLLCAPPAALRTGSKLAFQTAAHRLHSRHWAPQARQEAAPVLPASSDQLGLQIPHRSPQAQQPATAVTSDPIDQLPAWQSALLELADANSTVRDQAWEELGDSVYSYSADDEKGVLLLALAVPVTGNLVYGDVAKFVRNAVAEGTIPIAVEGTQFATELLRPTINGVLVPATAITLGTLLATTVNVLRQRQVDMRACATKEVCEIRLLRQAIFGMFGTAQHAGRRRQALQRLHDYSVGLVGETTAGAYARLDAQRAEGHPGPIAELEVIAAMLHGVDGAAASRQYSVDIATHSLTMLNVHRSERIAALLSGFPTIHWAVLGLLSTSIVFLFLIDSNQDVTQFLNSNLGEVSSGSNQLRDGFTLLLAAFSATGVLCLDLADPFRGPTTINSASVQLDLVRRVLQDDLRHVADEERDGADGPRATSWSWDAPRTAYFHLLTSQWGPIVKPLSDGAAWVRRQAFRRRRRG